MRLCAQHRRGKRSGQTLFVRKSSWRNHYVVIALVRGETGIFQIGCQCFFRIFSSWRIVTIYILSARFLWNLKGGVHFLSNFALIQLFILSLLSRNIPSYFLLENHNVVIENGIFSWLLLIQFF